MVPPPPRGIPHAKSPRSNEILELLPPKFCIQRGYWQIPHIKRVIVRRVLIEHSSMFGSLLFYSTLLNETNAQRENPRLERAFACLGVDRICPSLHEFKLAGLPSLIKPRLQRAVETQQNIPAFSGYGLHPVRFMASGRCWTEPDIDRVCQGSRQCLSSGCRCWGTVDRSAAWSEFDCHRRRTTRSLSLG